MKKLKVINVYKEDSKGFKEIRERMNDSQDSKKFNKPWKNKKTSRDDRLILEIENEEGQVDHLEISKEVYYKRPFKEGYEILELELKDLILEDEKIKARELCLSYLDKGLKSRWEVSQELLKNNIREEIVNETLSKIEGFGYIDDQVLTKAFIKSKIRTKGKLKVKKDLLDKGIDSEIIEDSFTDEVREEEYNSLLEACEKKFNSLKNREKDKGKLREKIMRFLLSRGYEYEMVKDGLAQVLGSCIDNEY